MLTYPWKRQEELTFTGSEQMPTLDFWMQNEPGKTACHN